MSRRGSKRYKKKYNSLRFSRKEINRIYESEKLKYINDKNLDINYEKIKIKSSIDSLKYRIFTLYIAAIAIISAVFAGELFTVFNSFHSFLRIILSLVLIVLNISIIMYIYHNKSIETAKKFLYYETCLSVLDDLEKNLDYKNNNKILYQ